MTPVIDPVIPRLVSTASAATILGVSRVYVHYCCMDGRIECRRVGDPGSKYRHIVMREELIRSYAETGIPTEKTGKPRLDKAIPPLLRTSEMAKRLGVSRGMVNNMYRDGLIHGGPVLGADLVTVDAVLFQPREVKRAEKHLEVRKVMRRTPGHRRSS